MRSSVTRDFRIQSSSRAGDCHPTSGPADGDTLIVALGIKESDHTDTVLAAPRSPRSEKWAAVVGAHATPPTILMSDQHISAAIAADREGVWSHDCCRSHK